MFGIILEAKNADSINEIIVHLGLNEFAFNFTSDYLENKREDKRKKKIEVNLVKKHDWKNKKEKEEELEIYWPKKGD